MPQIFLLSINAEKDNYWKNEYPLEKWQFGKNNDMIFYGEDYNILEGDVGVFYVVQKKAVCYIGRAYKKNGNDTYFEIILEMKNGFALSQIRKIQGLENPPLQQRYSKFGNQQAGLELVIKCFEGGEISQEQETIQNQKEQTMPNTPTPKNPPLNQILYGPPGTGKTYHTIDKALEILGIETQGKSRAELKAEFDKFRQNGQIEFITFHQSFSYEEFVEGIKPKFIKENEKSDKMEYEIANGIFKKICEKALKYQKWKEYEKLAHQFYPDMLKKLKEKNEFVYGDIAFELTKKGDEIQAKGTNGQAIFKDEMTKLLKLENSKNLDNSKLASGISIDIGFSHLYKAMRDYFFNEYLKDKPIKEQPQIESELKPYILIIDEINRGNISKILGELITLIEPSKRIGASEEDKKRGIGTESLQVTLPYSNESFGVPSNLYIIGTMNTADRSIALLDTALRRRFEFVEMMPKPELLETIKVQNDEIDLQTLLKKMNARIEFLLDREHTIGHSFFISVNSLNELQKVFKNKIIPLLQEYFYDDYAKIDAVLNGNGMVEITEVKASNLFPKKDNDLELEDKKIYKIKSFDDEIWDNLETYTKIYKNEQE